MDCGDVWFRHKLGDPLNHQVRFELFLIPIEDNTSGSVMFSVDWQNVKKIAECMERSIVLIEK